MDAFKRTAQSIPAAWLVKAGPAACASLLASTLLAAAPMSARAEGTAWRRLFTVETFTHAALHDGKENEREAQRCFATIDDEDASAGEALQVRLSVPLVREGDFAVLRTPALEAPLPTGTYRATVRMKVHGMLHTLGSAVAIRVGDQTREVWMNEFLDEDAYQEFSLLFESRPGDAVTRRDTGYAWGAPGGPGDLVPPAALPAVIAAVARNDLPWEERFSYWMAERVVAPRLKLGAEALPGCADTIRKALDQAGPDGLVANTSSEKPLLTAEVVQAINTHGANRPNGAVALFFPKNVTAGKTTRGPATPHPTLRSVTVDWVKLERLPEPENLTLRHVACRYPWRRPGEPQVIDLWLHNRSGAARTDTVRLLLRSGLRHEETLWEKALTLTDGAYTRVRIPWDIPAGQPPWGQAVVAQVVKEDQVVSEERTWFALHRFSNAVMVPHAPNTQRFLHPYAPAPPRTQNHDELFGANCTIYDSAGVVPDEEVFFEPYAVGNGNYMMSIPTITSVTSGLRGSGIAPFYYLESNGSAVRALEIFWDHPDWVVTLPANMDLFVLERERSIAAWLEWYRAGKGGEAPAIARAGGAYSGQLVSLNGVVRENVDRVIDGSLKLCEHTDFMGIRWDGIPFVAQNSKALGGDWGKTPEELAAITVGNIRRFRETLRARHPDFELRANSDIAALRGPQDDPFNFDRAYEIMKANPIHQEFASGHGSIMNEAWMSYGGFGTYANTCRNYLRAARFENAAFKMAGGHMGHMLWFYDGLSQYTPDEIYQQLFTFLAGSHVDGAFGPIPDSTHELGVYALRFSEFFWDPALRPIRDLPDKVDVDSDAYLWIHEAGFERETDDGGLLQIIPIINPPTTDIWLENRFGILPEPLRQPFGLSVRLPAGYTRVRGVYLLDNAPYPHVRELKHTVARGEVTFDIPELIVFKVVALEYAK